MRYIEPVSSSAIAGTLTWFQATLLGSAATIVAIISIASIGFLMLSGRIEVRRAAQVVFGCFIIAGASTIAASLVRASQSGASEYVSVTPLAVTARLPAISSTPQQSGPNAFDPYAGAAVPPR